ncbi:DUF397 domain-containing protein [Kitasatospora sp. NPDC058444]|uniref:DUF397 domain-containing protein n=1 Tax=Kitasatospora sp. NPDC058444 TaxID=3346504 RepID=UPI003647B350
MNATMPWFRSSYSNYEGGECIEVAPSPSTIHVRDSKDKAGPTLSFTPAAWSAFVTFAAEAQVTKPE